MNGHKIPIWIADYVLLGYGTGAIMAVPGHDERDFEFAQKFDLPIVRVVARSVDQADAPLTKAEPDYGVAVNSANEFITLDGLPTIEAKRTITDWLAAQGFGRKSINYKLRDWLFSRQRYWGEPFPILLDAHDRAHAVPTAELPVRLPDLDDFRPSGKPEPPLGKATDWVRYSDEYRARDQHDAPVGRLVLVLPPLHRPQKPRRPLGPRQGAPLDARRPLRRRRGARGFAPALQPVLA